jgi:hypothetical protein
MKGGGVVWCHGVIDGKPEKVNALIPILKMASVENGCSGGF